MKIAIAGYDIEGKASYEYWSQQGADITIVDENESIAERLPSGAKSKLGPGVLDDLNRFDMVIRTAGMNPEKIVSDGIVWSATNEFFSKCPAAIIGVTGTKGKGTTCSLIASIMRANGRKVHLVGNIGAPALRELPHIEPTDIVIYELSSFQLWDLKKSPHIAVVLMIEPDHLDVHKNMDEYVNAKANIRTHQTEKDICIYHPTNTLSRQIALSSGPSGDTAKRYGIPDDGQVYVKDNSFAIGDDQICSVDTLQLVGEHNIENACAAISVAKILGANDGGIAVGLRTFEGLGHRLKFIRKINGISYYDDSIATTPGSAIAALRSFDDRKVIILGGSDKGADYSELINVLKETQTEVIAIGTIGDKLVEMCTEAGVLAVRVQGDMETIVRTASEHAKNQQAIVILSPAAASFDMFKNYSDRGEQFISAVNKLEST